MGNIGIFTLFLYLKKRNKLGVKNISKILHPYFLGYKKPKKSTKTIGTHSLNCHQ